MVATVEGLLRKEFSQFNGFVDGQFQGQQVVDTRKLIVGRVKDAQGRVNDESTIGVKVANFVVSEDVAIGLKGRVDRDIALDLLLLQEDIRDARKARVVDLGFCVASRLVNALRKGVEWKRLIVGAVKIAPLDQPVALLLQRP